MKKFIFKICILFFASFLLIYIYSKMASSATLKYYGPNTAEQISMSFSNAIKYKYNCYILGNSRIYRNINPDKFPSVNAYNFGHDNDGYNQIYYKLLYLIENNAPIEYLILGTDYFQFSVFSDTRNYIYSDFFPAEYQKDYGNKSWLTLKKEYYTTIWGNKQNALEACVKLLLNKPAPNSINFQKSNGQYIVVDRKADSDDTTDRDYSILDIQLEYFRKIIDICEEKDIELYVVMPPLWSGETASHTDDERTMFDTMILDELKDTKFEGRYINYSKENGLSSYTDFTDVTHLNQEASDRFSEYINDKIFKEQ